MDEDGQDTTLSQHVERARDYAVSKRLEDEQSDMPLLYRKRMLQDVNCFVCPAAQEWRHARIA